MKEKIVIALFVLIATLCSGQQHRALLVGVADYPEGSGWRKIHSDNDVVLLSELLKDTYRVQSIVNEAATMAGIQSQLSVLERATNRGDTIIISFSCHGQQMVDDGDDEPDSLDEALVPYDAKERYSETYKGEKHLRDDYISECISRIRQRAGKEGFILVLLDACHSGDSYRDTKDTSYYRGGYYVFGPQGKKTRSSKKELRRVVSIDERPDWANVLYVGACQSYQTNAEMLSGRNIWYGSLSYAFYEAYSKYGLGNISTLCQEIKKNILRYNKGSKQCPEFASSLPLFDNKNMSPIGEERNETVAFSSEAEMTEEKTSGARLVVYYLILGVVMFAAVRLWRKK